ncbi:N-acetyltransferase [Geomonas sp. Red276]
MVYQFVETDIGPFLGLAREEGWICGRWEFEFLLEQFPAGCYVRREAGNALGYVTSVRYGDSGWIGNLLVLPEARRRGIGKALMELAIEALQENGTKTIWLTASEKGASIYKRLGFVTVDRVQRWVGSGRPGSAASAEAPDLDLVVEMDREGWGDRRASLLRTTCGRGKVFSNSGGFVCCQSWKSGMQLGPWGGVVGAEAEELLDTALAGAGERVFLDVPAGNRLAGALLAQRGFEVCGDNLLMYRGIEPGYRPQHVFSLASMGSMG